MFIKNHVGFSILFFLALTVCSLFETVRGLPESPHKSNRAYLVACVTEAFKTLGHGSKRIFGPSNDTYTDARAGKKIK